MSQATDSIAFHGMCIHKLHSNQASFDTEAKVEAFIERVVRKYNQKQTRDSHEQSTYKPVALKNWQVKQHHGFQARVYYSKRKIQTDYARWLSESSLQSQEFKGANLHFVHFLYRKVKVETTAKKVEKVWELFALTTNDGWQLVKHYADFGFPTKVAARLIDPSFSSTDTKSLAGHKDASSETFRGKGYALQEYETESLWKFFRKFLSNFSQNSSLQNPEYQLEVFQPKEGQKEVPKISVEIGVGRILIGKALTMKQYEQILGHFSTIARGEQTFKISDGKREEEKDNPAFRFLENIQPVEEELFPKLNNALVILIWKYFSKQPIHGELSFTHRYHRDFYASCEFTFTYLNQKVTLNHPPSIYEVMEILHQWFGRSNPFEEFAARLNQVRMKFNKKNVFSPLKDFFHGEMRYNGSVFFHVDNLWLQVRPAHLAVLQRSFWELLKEHLIDSTDPQAIGQLSKPWFEKKEWVAFTAQRCLLETKVGQKTLERALDALQKRTYCFIDDQGNVRLPYPTEALFDGTQLALKFVKTLRKNWESLRVILKEKQKNQEALTQKDLEPLFKKETKAYATELFRLLNLKRPIIKHQLIGRVQKRRVLAENGVPTSADLSDFQLKGKTLEDTENRKAIEKLFRKKITAEEACSQEDIEGVLPSKHKRYAESIYKQFIAPCAVNRGTIFGSNYLVEGPIPADFKADQALLDYLKQKHEDYTLVQPEEGYNRLYLDEKGFLVGDQAYAGNKEKLEIADLFQFGWGDELLLFAVKSGFRQSTRDAAAQIRAAAVTIRQAIDSGDYAVLHNLYNQVTGSSSTTPFRTALKAAFEALPTDKNDKTPSERFVRLFKRNREKIVFVYAFIDDGEGAERFLSQEKNPGHEFVEDDFKKDKVSFSQKVIPLLKQHQFLDAEGRISDHFLRATKQQFCKTLEKVKHHEHIFDVLHSKISKFDSLVAKIELLHLRQFLKEIGFGFKICQIPRSRQAPNAGSVPFFEWAGLSQEEWDATSFSADPPFIYNNQTYQRLEGLYDPRSVLAILFGMDPVKYTPAGLALKFRKLLQEKQTSHQKIVSSYFLTLFKKRVENRTLKERFLFQNVREKGLDLKENYLSLVKTYTEALFFPGFMLGEEEWELVARLLDKEILIFTQNHQQKVETTKPTSLNPEGDQRVILLKDRTLYQLCTTGKKEDEEVPASPSSEEVSFEGLVHTLSQEEQNEILTQSGHVGILNTNNDCFFISAMQLVLHSSLAKHLLNHDHLKGDKEDIYNLILEMALTYGLTAKNNAFLGDDEDSATVSFSSQNMRALLGLTPTRQEDAAEALNRMVADYDLDAYVSKFKSVKTVDETKAKLVAGKDPKKFSKLTAERTLETAETHWMLEIDPPSTTQTFQEAVNQLFAASECETSLSYTKNGKVYSVPSYQEELQVEELKDSIFFQVKRFQRDEETQQATFNSQLLTVEPSCLIGEVSYDLKGFVVHLSNTPTLALSDPRYGGHYIAYAKTSDIWLKFNDAKKPKPVFQTEALDAAKGAYLLYYEKNELK